MTLIHRTLLILLLATQAVFAVTGSSLVVCLEGSSTARFELLLGECCDDEPDACTEEEALADPDGHEAHSEQQDCGGCDDQQLVIAPVPNHEYLVADAPPTPGHWNLAVPGAARSQSDGRTLRAEDAYRSAAAIQPMGGRLAFTVVRC